MIWIDETHNGPANWGHGGVCGGTFAAELEPDGATVRFHRPIPLGSPLELDRHRGRVEVRSGSDAIATVTDLEGPLRLAPFPRLTEAEIECASRRWLEPRDGLHMAPACFACGHKRSSGGLGLRPGRSNHDGLYATHWEPPGTGRVPSWLLWAALDCPSGFPAFHAVGDEYGVVTGELSVHVLGPVHAGGRLSILSRLREVRGRRLLTEAVLLDQEGRPNAYAKATWISVPLAALACLEADA